MEGCEEPGGRTSASVSSATSRIETPERELQRREAARFERLDRRPVGWFNKVDATELNELNFGRFEARIERRL